MTLRVLATSIALALAFAPHAEPRNTWSVIASDLKFTPDGRYVVARTLLGVKICEMPNGIVCGTSVADYSDEVVEPAGMDVSPDGRRVAYVTNGKLVIASVPYGRVEYATRLRQAGGAVAFSPDGKYLAVAQGALEIWKVDGLKWLISRSHPFRSYERMAFFPDGRTLAGAGYGRPSIIDLWDTRTWTPRDSLNTRMLYLVSLAFSQNGRFLAVGGGGKTVMVWDMTKRQEVWRRDFTYAGYSMAYSQDARWLVSAGRGGKAVVLDARNGKIAWEWAPHDTSGMKAAAFSPDGHWLVTSGYREPIRLWDFQELARVFHR